VDGAGEISVKKSPGVGRVKKARTSRPRARVAPGQLGPREKDASRRVRGWVGEIVGEMRAGGGRVK
jgi:hypothetical protein